jgi:chromosome segregation ATPase
MSTLKMLERQLSRQLNTATPAEDLTGLMGKAVANIREMVEAEAKVELETVKAAQRQAELEVNSLRGELNRAQTENQRLTGEIAAVRDEIKAAKKEIETACKETKTAHNENKMVLENLQQQLAEEQRMHLEMAAKAANAETLQRILNELRMTPQAPPAITVSVPEPKKKIKGYIFEVQRRADGLASNIIAKPII